MDFYMRCGCLRKGISVREKMALHHSVLFVGVEGCKTRMCTSLIYYIFQKQVTDLWTIPFVKDTIQIVCFCPNFFFKLKYTEWKFILELQHSQNYCDESSRLASVISLASWFNWYLIVSSIVCVRVCIDFTPCHLSSSRNPSVNFQ